MSLKSCSIAAVAVFVVSCAAPAFAAEVTGILVDEACYNLNHANVTMAHPNMGDTCAQVCATKGNQLALVTKTGEVYEVMAMGKLAQGEKNAAFVPHMAHTVTLTGSIANGAKGKPKLIHATALKMVSQ